MALWADQLNKLASDLTATAARVQYEAPRLVAKHAMILEREMKRRAPKKSRRLERSIWATVNLVDASAQVGPFAFYAPFVEYGTSDTAPQPFVGPSLDAIEPDFIAELTQMGGRIL